MPWLYVSVRSGACPRTDIGVGEVKSTLQNGTVECAVIGKGAPFLVHPSILCRCRP